MTDKPVNVVSVASFRVPVPWDQHGPKFDGKTPSKLRSFLRNVQTICEKGKIVGEQERKNLVLDYLTDEETREQWERLHHYKTGTYDAWVREIEELFPELEDARVGTLARLKKICAENRGIEPSELGALRRFSVSFSNEADKLMQAPASIDNGQLVDMYLEVLEEKFAEQVNFMASQNKILERKNGTEGSKLTPSAVQLAAEGDHADREGEKGDTLVKRRGAKIPLSEIIGIAEAISDNWTGSSSKYSSSGSKYQSTKGESSAEKKMEGIAQILAHLNDKLDLVDKKIEEKIDASLKKSFSQNVRETPPHMDKNQSGGKSEGNNDQGNSNSVVKHNGNHNNSGWNGNNRNSGNHNGEKDMSCYYCWLLAHLIKDCPYKQEHIDMGYVKVDNGAIRLGDNRYVPKYPENKSRKERVDDYWAAQGKRKGTELGRLNSPQGQMLQYGFDQNTDQMNLIYDTRDDELRSMRVQMMHSQVPAQLSNQIMSSPQSHQQLVQVAGSSAVNQDVIQNMPKLPAGWDMNQFVQLINGLNIQASGNSQSQLIQTRTGAGSEGPANSNF